MATRESYIEGKIVEHARRTGWLAYKFSSPSHRGVPDRLFISPTGVVVFMELKAPGKKPTVLQLHEMQHIRERGIPVFWTDSVKEGCDFLDFQQQQQQTSNTTA